MIVRFKKVHGSYNPGECAGFDDADGAALVAKGVAVDVAAEKAAAAAAANAVDPDEVTDHHVAFLASRGYEVADVAAAKEFVAKLKGKQRAGFFKEAAAWAPPAETSTDNTTGDAEGGEQTGEVAEQ